MKQAILEQISTECPWRDTLYWYDTIDSTNTLAKKLAKEDAPHGTVIIAGSQTAGRGRMGRSFSSPNGMGVYLSVLLRPNCSPDSLMHLTCAAAVAGCEAVNTVSGIYPDIKWTNDLVFQKKKLGGILTELVLDGKGAVTGAIVGIGINCSQKKEDFPEDLQNMATSVSQITGSACPPEKLAAALIDALYAMDKNLLSGKNAILDTYRAHCLTIGKEIVLVRGDEVFHGTALAVDADGGLVVRFLDGTEKTVTSGEVSVRGMYGYI